VPDLHGVRTHALRCGVARSTISAASRTCETTFGPPASGATKTLRAVAASDRQDRPPFAIRPHPGRLAVAAGPTQSLYLEHEGSRHFSEVGILGFLGPQLHVGDDLLGMDGS
jgi:hypothetical protein